MYRLPSSALGSRTDVCRSIARMNNRYDIRELIKLKFIIEIDSFTHRSSYEYYNRTIYKYICGFTLTNSKGIQIQKTISERTCHGRDSVGLSVSLTDVSIS